MARDFAIGFYHSMPWRRARDAYMREGFGLCEKCLAKGRYRKADIVHHKIHLSPANINDPEVTLDFKNLERVCRLCHAEEHPEIYGGPNRREPRWTFDEEGNLMPNPEVSEAE